MARYHQIFKDILSRAKAGKCAAVTVVYPLSRVALAGAIKAACIVVGARVPIIFTSRAKSRLASCAVAVLLAEAHREGTAAQATITGGNSHA